MRTRCRTIGSRFVGAPGADESINWYLFACAAVRTFGPQNGPRCLTARRARIDRRRAYPS
jgi:hypothetical protein